MQKNRQSDFVHERKFIYIGEINPFKLQVLLLSLAISCLGVVVTPKADSIKQAASSAQSALYLEKHHHPPFPHGVNLDPPLCFNFPTYAINALFTSTVKEAFSFRTQKIGTTSRFSAVFFLPLFPFPMQTKAVGNSTQSFQPHSSTIENLFH